MTYPPCDECGKAPTVTRLEFGAVLLWHACKGHQIGYRTTTEFRAATWWGETYAAEGVYAPRSEAPEGRNEVAAPSAPPRPNWDAWTTRSYDGQEHDPGRPWTP